jgi:hypothetical protein
MVQEVTPSVVGVACVPYAWYGLVDIDALRDLHDQCTESAQSQESPCIAATHRYCNSLGYPGGTITEVRTYQVELGCIAEASYYNDRATGV